LYEKLRNKARNNLMLSGSSRQQKLNALPSDSDASKRANIFRDAESRIHVTRAEKRVGLIRRQHYHAHPLLKLLSSWSPLPLCWHLRFRSICDPSAKKHSSGHYQSIPLPRSLVRECLPAMYPLPFGDHAAQKEPSLVNMSALRVHLCLRP
jgi:hypothetical protein